MLAFLGLRRVFKLDWALGVRFAIVLGCFPLVYYVSHPETYYFRPVDPLIVILTAVALAGRRLSGDAFCSGARCSRAPAIAASRARV